MAPPHRNRPNDGVAQPAEWLQDCRMAEKKQWQRALVTGASSGIGAAMAVELAEQGTDLVVVARDTKRLQELAASLSVDVEVLTADLSVADQLASVAERLSDEETPIDLLVNNAGLGFTGDFVDIAAERRQLMVDVNVTALHELCAVAAAAMKARGAGTILNVSSVAGDIPAPQTATYNATKSFVTTLSQSLHMELEPYGVNVSCLCPGLTRTEFQERAGYDTSGLPSAMWQSAEEVARVGLSGAAAGKVVVVPGFANGMASKLARSVPRSVARWSASALNNNR